MYLVNRDGLLIHFLYIYYPGYYPTSGQCFGTTHTTGRMMLPVTYSPPNKVINTGSSNKNVDI